VELNIAASGGMPIQTGACVRAVAPFKNKRREIARFFVITAAIVFSLELLSF
jgi:hypothetical protein